MRTLRGITQSDPEILSGEPVFVGTRVPVRSLFEYLEGGETLPEFLEQFPSVRREQAIAVLESACETDLSPLVPGLLQAIEDAAAGKVLKVYS
jgi:uncharacterized protein (DUF433 family)